MDKTYDRESIIMIVAEQKPIGELIAMLEGQKRILILGCKGCVSVCNTGGAKEVAMLSAALRIACKKEGKAVAIDEQTIERQCEPEFVDQVKGMAGDSDAVLSLACGAGVQLLAERLPEKVSLPGCNTTFLGVAEELGLTWR